MSSNVRSRARRAVTSRYSASMTASRSPSRVMSAPVVVLMVREIHHLIQQMNDEERRTYLAESLFLNTVKYENDKLEAYMRKLSSK